jgi:excisionase family DNA binding protein
MESAHASTIEDAIAAALEAKLAPLRTEIHRLAEEVERLRHALPPPLVSMREAARALDVSLSTIRRRVGDGSLRTVRVGNMLRVDLGALHG